MRNLWQIRSLAGCATICAHFRFVGRLIPFSGLLLSAWVCCLSHGNYHGQTRHWEQFKQPLFEFENSCVKRSVIGRKLSHNLRSNPCHASICAFGNRSSIDRKLPFPRKYNKRLFTDSLVFAGVHCPTRNQGNRGEIPPSHVADVQ